MKKALLIVSLAVAVVLGLTAPAMAAVNFNNPDACSIDPSIAGGCNTSDSGPTIGSVGRNLISVALGVIGVVAVVVIVIAGQRYITSAGDPSKAAAAKNMILYGVVGLVLALLAWAIVNFVTSTILTTDQNSSGGGTSSSKEEKKGGDAENAEEQEGGTEEENGGGTAEGEGSTTEQRERVNNL